MTARRIVLAAGGTGGHMFPAQSLAEELRGRGWQTALITDARGLALAKAFPADPILTVDAATLSPRAPLKAIRGAGRIAAGVLKARRFMRAWRPDAVAGFGGYPALPGLAATPSATPMIIHEQNATLGRVNKLFVGRAAVIASGFSRLEGLPGAVTGRWRITGNPVRGPIAAARFGAYAPPEGDGPIRLFVIGGSQGARILSEITPRAIAKLPEALRARLEISQQTREDFLQPARELYAKSGVRSATCETFFTDVAERIASAHLVISRAGASSVTEIAVIGRPCILVPLGIAMDDHQTLNAKALVEAGGADMIAESALDGHVLAELLVKRLTNPQDLLRRAGAAKAAGRADAASSLADLVETVVAGRPI